MGAETRLEPDIRAPEAPPAAPRPASRELARVLESCAGKGLRDHSIVVLMAIISTCGRDGKTGATDDEIGRICGKPRRSVQRSMRSLEEAGAISVDGRTSSRTITLHLVTDLTQDGPELVPPTAQVRLRLVTDLTQDEPELVSPVAQDGPELVPGVAQAGDQLVPGAAQAGDQLVPPVAQAGPPPPFSPPIPPSIPPTPAAEPSSATTGAASRQAPPRRPDGPAAPAVVESGGTDGLDDAIREAMRLFGEGAARMVQTNRVDIARTLDGRFDCYAAALRSAARSSRPIDNLHAWCLRVAGKYRAEGIPPDPVSTSGRASASASGSAGGPQPKKPRYRELRANDATQRSRS